MTVLVNREKKKLEVILRSRSAARTLPEQRIFQTLFPVKKISCAKCWVMKLFNVKVLKEIENWVSALLKAFNFFPQITLKCNKFQLKTICSGKNNKKLCRKSLKHKTRIYEFQAFIKLYVAMDALWSLNEKERNRSLQSGGEISRLFLKIIHLSTDFYSH